MKHAAFFDIDGTLVHCITQQVLTKMLRDEGILNVSQSIKIFVWFALYKLGLVSDSKNLRKTTYVVFASRPKEQIDKIFQKVQDVINLHIRWSMKGVIEKHKRDGDMIIAITGSLQNLCVPICATFEIPIEYSTILDVANNRYTGFWKNEIYEGKKKRNLILELAKKYQLDLKESTSYADSYSDIPMLEVVGHAVAVNPDSMLRKYAIRNNWEIIEA